jgi:hypothetical protein
VPPGEVEKAESLHAVGQDAALHRGRSAAKVFLDVEAEPGLPSWAQPAQALACPDRRAVFRGRWADLRRAAAPVGFAERADQDELQAQAFSVEVAEVAVVVVVAVSAILAVVAGKFVVVPGQLVQAWV